MEKLLLSANQPSIGIELLRSLGVTEQLFPEIKALEEVPQDPEWHPEGDVRPYETCGRSRMISSKNYPMGNR